MNVWGIKPYAYYAEQDHIKSGLSMHDWSQEIITGQRTYMEELNQSLSRSFIIEKTYEGLTDKGWHTIYPDWFSSHKDHHGEYQILLESIYSRQTNLVQEG